MFGGQLLANIPQPILSLVYFGFNNLITSMLAAREWASFAKHKKGLRVSHPPKGHQCSTYFLSLPYRFSIPVLVLPVALHTFFSQSIFLVAMERYGPDGLLAPIDSESDCPDKYDSGCNVGNEHLTTGWSPAPLIMVVVTGFLMLVYAMLLAAQRLDRGLPVLCMGNSMIISAACHAIEVDKDMLPYKALKWGVVGVTGTGDEVRPDPTNPTDIDGLIGPDVQIDIEDGFCMEERPGHCAFTAGEPQLPVTHRLYARHKLNSLIKSILCSPSVNSCDCGLRIPRVIPSCLRYDTRFCRPEFRGSARVFTAHNSFDAHLFPSMSTPQQ